jgi:DNA-binding CsgD family transcriptional regulator
VRLYIPGASFYEGAMVAGAFVGRQEELGRLRALVGRGAVALVSGEAGIGKSALLRALGQQAAEAGACVLSGAAYDGAFTPTLGPWREALEELPPADAPMGAGEMRHRLFDAVSRRLSEAAGARPLVILMDDLHWADPDSLDLFAHVARFCGRRRQLLVGTYRDPEPELTASHPFTGLLAAVLRRDDCLHLHLRALPLDDASALLGQLAGAPLPQALLRALLDESAGNAFYLLELTRHLLEENKIVRRGGSVVFDASVEALAGREPASEPGYYNNRLLGITAGVRAVLGRRLERLSAEARTALARAAAFTGSFTLSLLAQGSDLHEDQLLAALEEARRAGLLSVSPDGRWRFSHAIVRRALTDELSPERRARLHRAAAQAMRAVDPEAHAELAALYHASRLLPGAEAGLPHALAGAVAARAVGALERAVSLLRMARDLAPPGAARRDAGARLAAAEAEALRFGDAGATAEAVVAEMVQAGDPPAAQAELLAKVAALLRTGGAPRPQVEGLVARGIALAGPDRGLTWARLRLLGDRVEPIVAGPVYVGRFVPPDPDAVALLRAEGNEDDFAATVDPYQARTREQTEALLARTRAFRSRAAAVRAESALVRDWFFRHHDMRATIRHGETLLADAERLGQIPAQAVTLAVVGCAQAGLGDLAGARLSSQRLTEVAERLGPHHRMQQVAPFALRAMLGYFAGCDWAPVVAPTRQLATDRATLQTPLGLVSSAIAVLGLSQIGDRAECQRLLGGLARAHREGGPGMIDWGPSRSCAAAAVWHLGLTELAPLYRELAADPATAGAGAAPIDCRELMVARMCSLLGEREEASRWFARARTVLEDLGLQPARAVTDLDEALTLERLAPDARDRARELAHAAQAAFQRIGMTPWLARGRELLARLEPTTAPPDGLTAREVEILRLLAAGHSNKEMAAALSISVATVERHIANVYDKIGVRGRANATTYALRHKL